VVELKGDVMATVEDQRESKAIQNLFRLLLNPDLNIFIDKRKLCSSEIFQRAIDMAINQSREHGNMTQLNSLITWLDGTAAGTNLVSRLKPNFEVLYTPGTPPKLRKVSLLEQLAGPPPVKTSQSPRPMEIKRSTDVEKSEDLMDSRLILPGSFGSGRRR
jgi:hypothetical protein